MTELPRLLEQSDDDFERALLGSALAERPRAAGLRDAALAIGLTVSAADALAASLPTTSLGAAGAAAPGAAATTPLGAAGAASATAIVLGKGVLGGALVTLLGLTAVDHFVSPPREPTLAPVVAQTITAPADVKQVLRAPALPSPATEEAAAAPEAEPRPVHAARRPLPAREPAVAPAPRSAAPANAAFAPVELPAPSSPAVVANPSLAAEIRQLDRARAALAAGDAATARQALDIYAANRPSPTLAHEAALLRKALRDLTHAP